MKAVRHGEIAGDEPRRKIDASVVRNAVLEVNHQEVGSTPHKKKHRNDTGTDKKNLAIVEIREKASDVADEGSLEALAGCREQPKHGEDQDSAKGVEEAHAAGEQAEQKPTGPVAPDEFKELCGSARHVSLCSLPIFFLALVAAHRLVGCRVGVAAEVLGRELSGGEVSVASHKLVWARVQRRGQVCPKVRESNGECGS